MIEPKYFFERLNLLCQMQLLHTCAHNPTGVDPSKEQWEVILEIVQRKRLIPLFDTAYLGFVTGDMSEDGWSVRRFADAKVEMLACQVSS